MSILTSVGQKASRGLQSFPSRSFSTTRSLRADFTHAVLGGGVVGLAIARQLSQRPDTSVVLIERHHVVGSETSSRNSEVIHAGIYYGNDTLKAKLCIRGKKLMYDLCAKHGIGHRRTGKWIVAQNEAQMETLEKMHKLCQGSLGVPTRWVPREEIERDGEGVRAKAGVLESPTTGIVDSHGLMLCLQGLFEENGGLVALGSTVQNVVPLSGSSLPGSEGWEVETIDMEGWTSTITTETLINAAGLGADDIHNKIMPPERQTKFFYAKGTYFSYSASSPKISRLIYPAPEPGAGGLGTHLTMDLAGRLRFGPDVEWVDSPYDLQVSAARFPQALEAIKQYLPNIDESCLQPDYAGIRPKRASKGAVGTGTGFQDFHIVKEEGFEGWVNLLGIESPGLTSSLAIGEMVEELLYGSSTNST